MGGMRKTLSERISRMTASEFAADIRAVSAKSQRFAMPKRYVVPRNPVEFSIPASGAISFPNVAAGNAWLATNFRRGE
jgi:hypothetical protein